ncbi:hypothetical protein Z517_00189 [Fonsecaea pedrosoi CBS 271.37]|uniref:Xylanolytic transcriptional activator regulatory domain-containing protein n=1 Tax=Fonsecaea pedrosoi CBS 271.37 TaxID=1442368 RepID=A0A0D2E3X9_9EURO|nr:uncharacterized protein Z517_00189 [Fonsecaea pedrosoi CBS 271.37]KIW84801.1 hypothetical protein Z517_00189 [Fonsecaea pedrosoi CBS 271.37]
MFAPLAQTVESGFCSCLWFLFCSLAPPLTCFHRSATKRKDLGLLVSRLNGLEALVAEQRALMINYDVPGHSTSTDALHPFLPSTTGILQDPEVDRHQPQHPPQNQGEDGLPNDAIAQLDQISFPVSRPSEPSPDWAYLNFSADDYSFETDQMDFPAPSISTDEESSPSTMIVAPSPEDASSEEGEDPDSELTQELSTRMGRLQMAEDGNMRYYGATSNMHLLRNGLQSLFKPFTQSVRANGQDALVRAGLVWACHPAYEQHLTDVFFTWHAPLLNEVDQDVYLREKQRYEAGINTPFFSPTLQNAIYCVATTYATWTPPTIKDDPAQFFARRTKVLLDIEMDCPAMATVQAILVISSYEASSGRDSRGTSDPGQAVQMVTDLGLHLNLEVETDDDEAKDELVKLRRAIFWSVYSVDTLWSSYIGRPSLMHKLESNVPLPEIKPNQTPGLGSFSANQNAAITYVPRYMAELTMKIGKITDTLYTGKRICAEEARVFVDSMSQELVEWKQCLPQLLQVDTSSIMIAGSTSDEYASAAVLQLLMLYYQAVILLHRPFLGESRSFNPEGVSPPSSSSTSTEVSSGTLPGNAPFARRLSQSLPPPVGHRSSHAFNCTTSATQICKLTILFRQLFTLRHAHAETTHILVTAGLIHAYNCCIFSGSKCQEAQKLLLICIQALSDMGQMFVSANRGLEVLLSLKRKWQNKDSVSRARK